MDKIREINFHELFLEMLKKWWMFIILMVSFAFGGCFLTDELITPVYQAESVLFIGENPNDLAGIGISIAELQTNNQLILDYKQIALTRLVIKEVKENIGMSGTIQTIRDNVSISTVDESRLINVSYRDTDPVLAAKVANELARQLTFTVIEVVGVENIRILDEALVPEKPVSPNKPLNIIISAMIGFMIALFIILLNLQLNNKIQSEKEIEELTGYPILGKIPKFKEGGGK